MSRFDLTLKHYKRKLQIKAEQLNYPRPFPTYLLPMIEGKNRVVVADIGSGPYSLVGKMLDGTEVEIVASDLLADEFNEMLRNAGIVTIVSVTKQNMEQMTYEDNSFDIVHCVNAVDHTENPDKALKEMFRVCKPGGGIYLRHFLNEGENNRYRGFHEWNITPQNGDCRFWSRTREFLLSSIYPGVKTEFRPELPYEPKTMVISTITKEV